jgi:hypothetical protein
MEFELRACTSYASTLPLEPCSQLSNCHFLRRLLMTSTASKSRSVLRLILVKVSAASY